MDINNCNAINRNSIVSNKELTQKEKQIVLNIFDSIDKNEKDNQSGIITTNNAVNNFWLKVKNTVLNKYEKIKQNSNINGLIEYSEQSSNTGDCWLLSSLNAISSTSWGREMIKDAIKPNGNGGAIITLKGSRGKQKVFNITKEELEYADRSGKYSKGDDDVKAFELAFEKYIEKYGNEHNISKGQGEGTLEQTLRTGDVAEIISGKQSSHCYYQEIDNLDIVLNEIRQHRGEYAITVGFKKSIGKMEDCHEFQLKGIITENGKKYAIIINPWDSSKKDKISYDKFKNNLTVLQLLENPNVKPNLKIKSEEDKVKEQTKQLELSHRVSQISSNILDEIANKLQNGGDLTTLKLLMNEIDKNIIIDVLDKLEVKDLIKYLDSIASGWGNGKNKKALISPIIKALAEKAKDVGIDSKIIQDFKKTCNKELDAIIYTDAKVIQSEVEKMVKLIKSKS